jgi:hypothetical protein
MADEPDTLLEIDGPGIAPYSARGLSQSFEPINQITVQRRTVRGELKNIASDRFKKFRSTISCTDLNPPALDNWWPGMQVIVTCVGELSYADLSGAEPSREMVSGSERSEEGFIFYRPVLTMLFVAFNWTKDEYGAKVGWTMTFEEV